jgi:NAD(P)-dependent dehydrogenase (short-subunit alcohol dehydrogenase family)
MATNHGSGTKHVPFPHESINHASTKGVSIVSELSGKVAIITGASRGIGFGLSQALLNAGCRVGICSRDLNGITDAAKRLTAASQDIISLPVDVSDEADVQKLFDEVTRKFGPPDIVVNNAGAFDGGPVDTLSLEAWNNVVGSCLTGSFLCTRAAFATMKPRRRGRILNIGSISAQRPRENSSAYTAAKFGVQGLTYATALEGRPYGISVSCLHPGNVLVERRVESGLKSDAEPMMEVDCIVRAAMTMLTMPDNVNFLEAIVLPNEQLYVGRG